MPPSRETYALLLVEGYTEVIFYDLVKRKYFRSARSKIINLKGNWDIDKKILDEVSEHAKVHAQKLFSVLICIDRESRNGKAPINLELIKQELSCFENINVSEILLFEAIQDIESWFFHDVDSIFQFIRLPLVSRDSSKYRPVEKLCHRNLTALFDRAGKDYRKGNASRHFLESLDLDKIKTGSTVLDSLCSFMQRFL